MRLVAVRMRGEHRGRHAGVVHSRDGRAHDDRGQDPLPRDRGPEREPQRGDRSRDRDEHRERDQDAMVVQLARHEHRRHAGIVHRHDADPHEQSAEDELQQRRLARADDVEPAAGDGDRDQQRKNRQARIITDRHRHHEGEHGDEMHRPDAAAHRERRGREPRMPHPAMRGPDAAAEIQRRIRRKAGDREGERDEVGVVCAGYGHGIDHAWNNFPNLTEWSPRRSLPAGHRR